MKQFLSRYKILHIWLLADLCLLAAFWLCRGNRAWMNAIADRFTGPLRTWIGRLCYHTSVSVMEVLYVLLGVFAAVYAVCFVIALVRKRGQRRACFYRGVLGAGCIALTIYAGFCLLWGVNYWTDSFQDKSGIYAQPVAPEELLNATVYFAQNLYECADQVERDENGVFAVPREEIIANSPKVYDRMEEVFPFLEFEDTGVKPMFFSHFMSMIDFTGFYCPYTGETNVNVHSPACMLPSTAAHEMAHQRGIASEQECNFLAILASISSGDPVYQYSGWLMGYIHLSNALYRINEDTYWAIRRALPETVEADLRENTEYWDQYRDTKVQKVSNKVYDGVLKAYGDENGIQSYGTVVDLLVSYLYEK